MARVDQKSFYQNNYDTYGISAEGVAWDSTQTQKRRFSAILSCLGDLDELNCQIGVIIALKPPKETVEKLQQVQNLLFNIGANIAGADLTVKSNHIKQLEQDIDQLQQQLPALTAFILPSGDLLATHCHLARAICRRAERAQAALNDQDQSIPANHLKYINRLSDWLFVHARGFAYQAGVEERLWCLD